MVGKIGLSTVLWTTLGTILLTVRRPPSPMSSASARNGLLSMTSGSKYERVEILHVDVFVAVADEAACEVPEREPEHDVAAERPLRELIDVADLALEDVDAGGDRPVEQERLGERDLVVLRPRPGLERQRQRLAAAHEVRGLERQLTEEPLELRHAGAERELVAVLLLELQRDVDVALRSRRDLSTLMASPSRFLK